MARVTSKDVARCAGVGVATVDRVLNSRAAVAPETAARVLAAAEALGFHAVRLLRARLETAPLTLGFVLQSRHDAFYAALGGGLAAAAQARHIRAVVEHVEDLTPGHIAARLRTLKTRARAVGLVAAEHPLISAAVEEMQAAGVPVFCLLSDLSTPARAGFIGVDPRRRGRTAGWAVSRLAAQPGPVGIMLGSPRYLEHEMCEISFRSYLREHAPAFRVLEPLINMEDAHLAREGVAAMLRRHPDLAAIYATCGGVSGIMEALREHPRGRDIVAVCNELVPAHRQGLIDGTLDVVLDTPLDMLTARAVDAMAAAVAGEMYESRIVLPFVLYGAEMV
ncbi:LacI family DNA-binding transcriptional regulator [Acidocella sp.]|uniref:LacI family DNA-binding transcriptional regulator n=1 Tax=Acidocella sp. TaxID=50710 RepID=UPI0026344A02|nr:LacI family DNA-binding transcriptional regulator [Acidocella sp.]